VKLALRTFLLVASLSLLISSALLLTYGKSAMANDSVPAVVIWYSLIFSMGTFLYSISVLIVIAIYSKYKKQKVWPFIKKEVLLAALTLFMYLLFLFSLYLVSQTRS
jgi:hypothetical protein